MADTTIEWTDKTWNPVVGCDKVSAGCKNCYAKTIHDQRHKAHLAGKPMAAQYAQPFEVIQLKPERLTDPLHWKKPQRVFVNSVSDLFHANIPDDFINQVFRVMLEAKRHTFQILTKRPERMAKYVGDRWGYGKGELWEPAKNVWLGTSVENVKAKDRIDILRNIPAAVRFLSIEPLLEDIGTLNLESISWVIAGGESGSSARPCNVAWIRSIVEQCKAAGVPVFVKQLGSVPQMRWSEVLKWKSNPPAVDCSPDTIDTIKLRDKKGGDMDEWPSDLRIREMPKSQEI